ncbi:unnamed protein product, partial [Cyprideis torosa]
MFYLQRHPKTGLFLEYRTLDVATGQNLHVKRHLRVISVKISECIIYNRAGDVTRHTNADMTASGVPSASPEKPQRADTLLAAALSAGCEPAEPTDTGLTLVSAVHTPEYLRFLKSIYNRWQALDNASSEVIPNIHPNGRTGRYPDSAVGQAGYHMADTACPISSMTFAAALTSAHSAATAAQWVLDGEPVAYALCRPPGHHAFRDMA